MSRADYIAQPVSRTTLDALQAILQSEPIEAIDIAVAYVTSGGAYDFLKRVNGALGADWQGIPKRWITSFDYCRSEPIALDCLSSVANSSVRVYDATFCLTHGGNPKVPFHPKTFLIRANQFDYALAGSGNMSRSGLSRGVEAGLVVGVSRDAEDEESASGAINSLQAWFTATWAGATPLTPHLLGRYRQLFEAKENLKAPVPTEDDVASGDTSKGALSEKDLKRLRVCRHFWTEAGNVTKNRGPHLPGNQLMMKRLSRVFFGFSPIAVPENTHIGDVQIAIGIGAPNQYSLTYSDNKMDKLTLPIPGNAGPPAYDGAFLLFQRLKPGIYRLSLGTKADKALWTKRSAAIDGAFKMSSGREWGVF